MKKKKTRRGREKPWVESERKLKNKRGSKGEFKSDSKARKTVSNKW